MKELEWIVGTVTYFRSLGFFKSSDFKSAMEIACEISAAHIADWGAPLSLADPLKDLLVLRSDPDRVWWEDTEADVCAGNDVYCEFLLEWSRISRKTFLPTQLVEEWRTETGPIDVRFRLAGKDCSISPHYIDDYVDMAVLEQINSMVPTERGSFQMLAPFDQTAFVVFLASAEKKRLESERGWMFAEWGRP